MALDKAVITAQALAEALDLSVKRFGDISEITKYPALN